MIVEPHQIFTESHYNSATKLARLLGEKMRLLEKNDAAKIVSYSLLTRVAEGGFR